MNSLGAETLTLKTIVFSLRFFISRDVEALDVWLGLKLRVSDGSSWIREESSLDCIFIWLIKGGEGFGLGLRMDLKELLRIGC